MVILFRHFNIHIGSGMIFKSIFVFDEYLLLLFDNKIYILFDYN